MAKIIIIGAGEHARVVLDSLQNSGHEVPAMVDPKFDGKVFMGVPVHAEYNQTLFVDMQVIIAVGGNSVRKKLSRTSGYTFGKAIDSSAIVSRHASIGEGVMILHQSIVQQGAVIGNHVILNTGSQVDHDCKISDYVHIAPGSVLCGRVSVGEGSLLGAGCTVIPGIKIGAWCVVGGGTVVTKDLPDYAVAVGNPARIIKYVKPSE